MTGTGNEIELMAAHWASIAFGGWSSPDEEQNCAKWLAEDPRHLGAFARAMAILETIREAQVLEGGGELPLPSFEDVEPGNPLSRRRLLAGLVASIALSAVLKETTPVAHAMEYRTARGQRRVIELPDGLKLTMNTESALTLRLGLATREVTFETGEVVIDEPAGNALPLRICVNGARATTSGGAFSISRIHPGPTDFLVTTGEATLQMGPDSQTLNAGSLARLDHAKMVSLRQISSTEQESLLSWRDGVFRFHDITLAEAAAEFARYSDLAIRLGDSEVGALRVTGVFSLGKPRAFAEAVGAAFNLRVVHEENDVLLEKN